jgi:hypothetical protein
VYVPGATTIASPLAALAIAEAIVVKGPDELTT